jgi:8-amino-7-oxononanoate synthase
MRAHAGTADFTSALYLGLRHATPCLRPWTALTTGGPAALGLPPPARGVAAGLAALVGSETAILAPSTLHALWDTIAAWPPGAAWLLDAGAYPTSAAAVLLGRARAPIELVGHYDTASVGAAAHRLVAAGRRPVLLLDATCPSCGRLAPLRRIVEVVGAADGALVVDDTQALGILGAAPDKDHPWGIGGGGLARFVGILPGPAPVVVVASLAKGFGAPLAVVAGPRSLLARIEAAGPSRIHSSPPSAAHAAAAERALRVNHVDGERVRRRLLRRVTHLRRLAAVHGVPLVPSSLPTQLMPLPRSRLPAARLALAEAGVRAPIVARRCSRGAGVALLVTVDHGPDDIQRAVRALARITWA